MSPRGAELLRRAVLFLASMVVVTLVTTGGALTQTQPTMDDADPYIVVLDEGLEHPSQVASGIEQRQDIDVGFVYSNVLDGFSAEIPEEDLAAVRADPRVERVVPDGTVHAVQTTPWGMYDIGAEQSSADSGDGDREEVSNVNVYVIDTGVYKRHPDLNVVVPSDPNNIPNFTGGKYTDCGEGHGTHVAGVVAAKDNDKGVVGVAPGAPVTSVKVLGCNGPGLISTVIKGIDWVTKNARKPAIANVSLSAEVNPAQPGPTDLLDAAVRDSADASDGDGGIFYSVAAGNDGKKVCVGDEEKYSPASAGRTRAPGGGWISDNGVVTTAATREDREETSWSNFGDCVDLWAPGKDILSTKNGGGTSKMWGTSMAAPHVGGTAALYLSRNTLASPAAVEDRLKVDAARVQSEDKRSKDETRIKIVYAGDY